MNLAKKEVDHWQEITRPDIFGMTVEKNRPSLIEKTSLSRYL